MAAPIIVQVGANASGVTSAITAAAQRAQAILAKNPIKINTKSIGGFKTLSADADRFTGSLTRMSAVIQTFGQSAAILFGVQNAFVSLVKSTIDVEKQIASIGVVFNKSGAELEKFANGIFEVAKNTGQAFDVTAKAAEEFARQGLSAEETLKRTRDTMILVRTTGLDTESAVEALTSTFNTFKKEVGDTTKVVNTFRNVDTAFAVSAGDLAEGIKRAGSSAIDAKVSFNELNALITTLKQNTGRSGSVIGNSFKSIFTNLQNAGTLNVLENVGVSTLDLEGNIRPAVEILEQLATKVKDLSDTQAAEVKAAVAGKYQINALNSLLQDLSSNYSTYSEVLRVANETTNEAEVSNERLNQTLSASLNEATQNLTKFAAYAGNLTLGPALKNLLGGFNSLFDGSEGETAGQNIGEGILRGIGAVLSGPGVIVAFSALYKISRLVLAGAFQQIKTVLTASAQNDKILAVQQQVLGVMNSQNGAIQAALAGARTREQYEATILGIIRGQNQALLLQQSVARGAAQNIVNSRSGTIGRGGYIPSFAAKPKYPTFADPLKEAVGREVLALQDLGYSASQAASSVKVQSSQRLVSSQNPLGLGVFNTLQGQTNLNKAFGDHQGENLKKSGIPNFAPLPRGLPGFGQVGLRGRRQRLAGGGFISSPNITDTANFGLAGTQDLLNYSETLAESARFVSQNRANFRGAEGILTNFSKIQRSVFSNLKGRAVGGDAIATRNLDDVYERRREALAFKNSFKLERNRLQLQRDTEALQKKEEARQKRMARLQGGAIGLSIAAPLLSGQIAQQFKDPDKANLTTGIGSAVGSAALIASLFPNPIGIAAALGVGGTQALSSVSDFQRSRTLNSTGIQRDLEKATERRQTTAGSVNDLLRAIESRREALSTNKGVEGATKDLIEALRKIEDRGLFDSASKAIFSGGLPEEEIKKAFQEQDKINAKEVEKLKTLDSINARAEENASSFRGILELLVGGNGGGFQGFGNLDTAQKKSLAQTIANSIDLNAITPEFSKKIRQQAVAPEFAKDVLKNLPNSEVVAQLRKTKGFSEGFEDSEIEGFVAQALASRQDRQKSERDLENQFRGTTPIRKASKDLINASKELLEGRARARNSNFDIGIAKAQEALNGPTVNGLAKFFGQDTIERASIKQNALSQVDSILNGSAKEIFDTYFDKIGAKGIDGVRKVSDFAGTQFGSDPIAGVIKALSEIDVSGNKTQEVIKELKEIKRNSDLEIKKLEELRKVQIQNLQKEKAIGVSKTLRDPEAFKASDEAFVKFLNSIDPAQQKRLENRALGQERFFGSTPAGRGAQGGREDFLNLTRFRGERGAAKLDNEESRRALGLDDFNKTTDFTNRILGGEDFDKVVASYKKRLDNEVEFLLPASRDRTRFDAINRSVGTIQGAQSSIKGGDPKIFENIIKNLQTGGAGAIQAIPGLFDQLRSGVKARGRFGNISGPEQEAGLEQIDALQAQIQDLVTILGDDKRLSSVARAGAENIVGTVPAELLLLGQLTKTGDSQLQALNSIAATSTGILSLLGSVVGNSTPDNVSSNLDQSLTQVKEVTNQLAKAFSEFAPKVESLINLDISGNFSLDGKALDSIVPVIETVAREQVLKVISQDRAINGNKTSVKTTR